MMFSILSRSLRRSYTTKYFPRKLYQNNRFSTKPLLTTHQQQVKVRSENNGRIVSLLLQSPGDPLRYPTVWLRDNCTCSECFHEQSMSRTIDWEVFDVNIQIRDIWFDNNTDELKITWNDQHETVHSLQWLQNRQFTAANQKSYLDKFYRPQKHLWSGNDYDKIINNIDYMDTINSDNGLLTWLNELTVKGVAMIKNTPLTPNECRKLANRVNFIRKTHYGEEFIVQAKPDTKNVAYLSTPLQLHTDLPYYEYKPGANLLHCLVQSESTGGQNTLADGFYVAEIMKQNYPAEYQLLSTVLVNWSDVGEENENHFHSIFRAPVICEGRDGNLERINYSVPQRDSFFSVPIEIVDDWYRALHKFVHLIHEESVMFKTIPGDILTFDNTRMVHGRKGYDDQQLNTRYIVGAYLDWDEIHSRRRVLLKTLNKFDSA